MGSLRAVAFVVFMLLFVPIVELYVIVQVAQEIGVLYTLLALILVSLVGVWVVKHEGLRVWTRFQQQIAARRVPSRELADGVMILIAGVLLVLPGFVTGAIGALLLLPPVRALLRPLMLGRFAGTVSVVRATYRRPGGGGAVYDTTAQDSAARDTTHDEPPARELPPGDR